METGLTSKQLATYSPLVLAYLGDGTYELFVRAMLVEKHNEPVQKLHKKATHYVKAAAQSRIMEVLEPMLTEEELAVFKRGRNAKSHTMPKNADMAEYRRATGFEALIGYLYLKQDTKRMTELMQIGIDTIEADYQSSNHE
ncbi:MAG: ribonuclease III [Lachnospiraceae bacterium]|nr:ribonuclease III [Lachnospiraceae bacterium]